MIANEWQSRNVNWFTHAGCVLKKSPNSFTTMLKSLILSTCCHTEFFYSVLRIYQLMINCPHWNGKPRCWFPWNATGLQVLKFWELSQVKDLIVLIFAYCGLCIKPRAKDDVGFSVGTHIEMHKQHRIRLMVIQMCWSGLHGIISEALNFAWIALEFAWACNSRVVIPKWIRAACVSPQGNFNEKLKYWWNQSPPNYRM